MLFSLPNMEAVGARLWARWSPENWAAHIHHPSAAIEAALREAGFELQRELYRGVPFLGMRRFETPGVLPKLVGLVQTLALGSCYAVPFYDRVGGRSWSWDRVFLARPRAHTPHAPAGAPRDREGPAGDSAGGLPRADQQV